MPRAEGSLKGHSARVGAGSKGASPGSEGSFARVSRNPARSKNLVHPRAEITETLERIYSYKMTTTSGGNISIRDENGDIWITPARVDKGTLRREDIVCIHADGTIEGRHRPSSEHPFHQAIYEARPDLRAIVHAHPVALVSFSICRQVPNTNLFPQAAHVCGRIGYAPYALPGSAELGDKIAATFAEGFHCVILENHGVVVGGTDLGEAFQRFETLEFTAKTIIKAGVLCGVPATHGSNTAPERGELVAHAARRDGGRDVRVTTHTSLRRSGGGGSRDHSAETADGTSALRRETSTTARIRYLSEKQIALAEKRRGELATFVPTEATTREKALRQELCDFIRRGYRQRLFTSTEGSFSARLSADSFLITCYRVDRKTIALDQLALIRGGRAETGSRPSRAVRIHEAIYRRHPSVQAVVNAMPVNATAFSVTGMGLDARTIPESYIFLRDIGVVPFGEQFGDGEAIARAVSMKVPAMFMENNGVLVLGTSVLDAFDRLEVFESTAEALINARPIGEVMPMEVGRIGELRKAFGME